VFQEQCISATSQPSIAGTGVRWGTRTAFVALLATSLLIPQLKNSFWTYPAVPNPWVLAPFCALFLLALIDLSHPWQILHLDLLVLLSFVVALAFWSESSFLPLLFVDAPLVYLGARMAMIARIGRSGRASATIGPRRLVLSRRWLLVGIAVLAVVHVSWTLSAAVNTDVGEASVSGAMKLVHGTRLYGVDRPLVSNLGYDPHFDTYGPVVYEAYVPFAAVASPTLAARLATLFFDLLTAALLFALGRRTRGLTAGVTLAYCWLAFPFTLYAGGLASNDSLVAAALVGTLLVAQSPVRRGAMLAVAALSKLSPLALVPLLAGHDLPARGRRAPLLRFAGAFALVSLALFLPAVAHGGANDFLGRTLGFQAGREPAYSIWERLGGDAFAHTAPWIKDSARVLHGLLVAVTVAAGVALLWLPRRRDVIGLAGASAALLMALQLCDGYYTFTYILWFAPLVLVALLLSPPQAMTVSALGSVLSTSGPSSPTATRSSIRTPSSPGRYTPGSTVTTLPISSGASEAVRDSRGASWISSPTP
jgi:Glycosyltransferase family 87